MSDVGQASAFEVELEAGLAHRFAPRRTAGARGQPDQSPALKVTAGHEWGGQGRPPIQAFHFYLQVIGVTVRPGVAPPIAPSRRSIE